MPDAPDMQLVREFARTNSEAAFAELVRRHLDLVYSVARRCTGNDVDAQDVTQAVFIVLASKAGRLRQRTLLPGWLYETTRFTAAHQVRANTRRLVREQEAYMQSALNETDTVAAWEKLAPHLESAMSELSGRDRALLVLRFYQGKTGAETAALLNIHEAAAHKRLARALEKLREFFAGRGVVLSAAAIAGAVSANSVQAAPAILAKTISAVALTKGVAATASTLTLVKGVLKIMSWTKTQTVLAGLVLAGLATYSTLQYQAQAGLRAQNESLRQQVDRLAVANGRLSAPRPMLPRLPAPQMQMTNLSAALPAEPAPSTNLWARLKDKNLKLTHEQVEAYLKANGRGAASLLAAFRTSGDPALLKEAMEKFPNDPQVDFEASVDKSLSPAEQRQWLDAFEKSAPDNALPNYLSALNHFNAGEIDQGVQELSAAANKSLNDYSPTRIQDDVEAYLAAGYPAADASELGGYGIALPQLLQMKQLGLDAVDLANAYRQAGDAASAQAVLQSAVNLGQTYLAPSSGGLEISQLVGISIDKTVLSAMDPASPYGNGGQTVQDQLNQLAQQRASILDLSHQATSIFPQMSDQDWILYQNRLQIFGEQNAQHWLINKYSPQP